MMMKRFFSILSIVFAVVILQVAAIIPHHHHGDIICIVLSHCGRECDDGCSPDCAHHHDNEDKTQDTNCIIKTTFVVAEAQDEIKYKVQPNDGHNHNFNFIPVFLFLSDYFNADAELVYSKYRHGEGISLYKSINVNCTNGLRAPPYSVA
jgi:hypothetical protein